MRVEVFIDPRDNGAVGAFETMGFGVNFEGIEVVFFGEWGVRVVTNGVGKGFEGVGRGEGPRGAVPLAFMSFIADFESRVTLFDGCRAIGGEKALGIDELFQRNFVAFVFFGKVKIPGDVANLLSDECVAFARVTRSGHKVLEFIIP